LAELAQKTVVAIEKIEDLLSSNDIKDAFTNLNALMKELEVLSKNLDTKTDGLSQEFKVASGQLTSTLKSLQSTLEQSDPLIGKTSAAMDEVSNSARALRRLADYLEQHPESLLRGKR
jgi:paraquat-inducible protein B